MIVINELRIASIVVFDLEAHSTRPDASIIQALFREVLDKHCKALQIVNATFQSPGHTAALWHHLKPGNQMIEGLKTHPGSHFSHDILLDTPRLNAETQKTRVSPT